MKQNAIKIREKEGKMELEERVIDIIRNSLDYHDEISINDNMVNKLGIDSLDLLMIINSLEDTFSIRIEDQDLKELKTVCDVVEKLKVKLVH
jgi:acyl carrier protein